MSKRKRSSTAVTETARTELLSFPEKDSLCPLLATIPSTLPPRSLSFELYNNVSKESSELHASTGGLWFNSSSASSDDGAYVLCAYSRKKRILSILPPAPLHAIRPELPPPPIPGASASLPYAQARADLTAAFGSRKSLRSLAARERNVLKKEGLGGDKTLGGVVRKQIQEGAKTLLSMEELQDVEVAGKPIPPVDMETKQKEKIYRLDVLMPHAKDLGMEAIGLFEGDGKEAARRFLYAKHSTYLSNQFEKAFELWKATETNDSKRRTRAVLYLSILFFVNQKFPHTKIPEDYSFPPMLGSVPETIKTDLLETFSELPTGTTERRRTPHAKQKLLAYIAAISLHISEFRSPVAQLATDLQMPEKDLVEIFKSIGCKVEKLSEGRVATLQAPIQFPKPKKGPKNRS
ncbi:hypothetical protein BT69DRAFT_1319656 [Atractiella rhizophila]|nr:hypothetical protein BT69DRAFT_1324859 [Atractiella rhizophila]KAH8923199.1 hypothetical protein BT69DRAFT_1319656 [Atractiella rhizophila]